jgi:hypothetical protein
MLLQFVIILLIAASIGALLLAARLCILYKITDSHFMVFWLGMPVRSIPLESIKSVSSRPNAWVENWSNVPFSQGRRVCLHLTRGLFKCLVVTPVHPYVFRTKIQQSRQACLLRHRPPIKSGDTDVFLSSALSAECAPTNR